MTIMTVLVEGASATAYLADAVTWFDPAVSPFAGKVQNGGGYSDIESRLVSAREDGLDQSIFVVWDRDVLTRPGAVQVRAIANHRFAHTFNPDFEAVLPAWMLIEALTMFDPDQIWPPATHLHQFRRLGDEYDTEYERLVGCARQFASKEGRDPSSVVPPSKVELAKNLALVARRTGYQPPEIRRLFERLLTADGKTMRPTAGVEFKINHELVGRWGLSGRIACYARRRSGQIMSMDLDAGILEMVAPDEAKGPPNWAPNGSQLAFPSEPSAPVTNDEAVRVVNLQSGETREFLRIGHNLCWTKTGLLCGNTLGKSYVVTLLNPASEDRRVLDLPGAPIVACVDRTHDRILVGEQGRQPGRVCGLFRVNDGHREWDSTNVDLRLAEYSAPAVNPDGTKISWPVEESASRGLWVITIEEPPATTRLTPPEGNVQTSTWSPDGRFLAFMWSRWPGDPIRMWVADVATRQLAVLLEGPFGDAGVNALGCHSWAGSVERHDLQAGKIAFGSNREGRWDVYVGTPNSLEVVNLTRRLESSVNRDPAWSPDGRELAICSARRAAGGREQYCIVILSHDGTNERVAATDGARPRWAADGSKLSFHSTNDNHLWVVAPDATGLCKLTPFVVEPEHSWSPDGKVAFTRRVGDVSELWVIESDGDNPRKLSLQEGHHQNPAWSPDGKLIAYSRIAPGAPVGREALWIMDVALGVHEKVIDSPDANDRLPCWSPNGTHLAFVRYEANGHQEVYTASSDGSGTRRVTHSGWDSSGSGTWPDWGR